jgi:competence protein ComEC
MAALEVGSIIEGGSEGRSGLYARFRSLADSLRVPRVQVSAGDLVGGDLPARVYVLGPDGPADTGPENLNDRSVVLLVRYGRTTVLFPGDAEEGSEHAMVGRYGAFLDADILKAGHHGSRTSSSEAFVADVTPAWTVISSGEGNSFGHPSPVVLSRLAGLGSALHRTDRSGAAVFESDGSAWSSVDWRR